MRYASSEIVIVVIILLLIPTLLEPAVWEVKLEIGLSSLNYQFRKYVEDFVRECSKEGISVWIYETWRSKKRQQALYAQGRQPLEIVNEKRKEVGLPLLREKENRYIVTKLRVSAHNYGLAADFVPVVNGRPQWNNNELWQRCGEVALRLGMEWGGTWKGLSDKVHIQMKDWRKVATFNHLDRLIIE